MAPPFTWGRPPQMQLQNIPLLALVNPGGEVTGLGPGAVGFSTTSCPLPKAELKMCSEYLFSRVISNSEDMPGTSRAWCLTVFSWAVVMPCSHLAIHGVRVTTSLQVTLDPGSRPGFIVLRTYSTKALTGRLRRPYMMPSALDASSPQNCNTATIHFQASLLLSHTSPLGMFTWDGLTGTWALPWCDSGRGVNMKWGNAGMGYLNPASRNFRPQSAMATICKAKQLAFLPK